MKRVLLIIVIFLFNSQAAGNEFHSEEVEFMSQGVALSGTIVFSKSVETHAAVVFVHGSGKQERNIELANQFAKEGIAALVYDKRGVGKSGGTYEMNQSVSEKNITLLSDDAISALNALSNHPVLGELPLGLTGISQAGWIIPLAAEKSRLATFMVLWSGPVCKVSEEDIFSKYTSDIDDQKVPSYEEALKSRKQKYIWPRFLGKDSDPSDSLAKLAIPGLWIFGAKDGSIPVDLSIERLQYLIDSGHEYDYALFSGLGHNNMADTFATASDWIKKLSK